MKKDKAPLYRGFESVLSETQMSYKMVSMIFWGAICMHLTAYFFILLFWMTDYEMHIGIAIIKAYLFKIFSPHSGITLYINGETYSVQADMLYSYVSQHILPNINLIYKVKIGFALSFLSYFFIYFIVKEFKKVSEKYNEKEYTRGAKLISNKEFNKSIRKKSPDIPIGDIKLPKEFEIQHVFFIGSPGAGKTVFVSQVLERVFQRDERCLIYDNKGDFIAKFYQPGRDIIFNPLDERCVGWNVFNEIKTEYDIDAVATSLIPPATGDSVFWNDAARDVFSGILIYLYQQKRTTNADIWKTVTLDIKELSNILKMTPGAERGYVYIQDGSSKQAISIHSVLMQYAKSFSYLNIDGDFSIAKWIQKPTGNIYVPNYANTKDTLKPILSLFVDLIGRQLLSLSDDFNRRIFIFIDEFGTLQRLSTIKSLLTLGRSKGASVWIGIQDIGQIEAIYGKSSRQTIVNACGTSLIFRVNDPTEAQYLSEKIGNVILKVPQENFSMGVEDLRDGFGVTKSEKTEPLIMPSEIQSLNNLEAIIKFVGNSITKIKFIHKPFENKNPSFIENTSYRLEEKFFGSINDKKKAPPVSEEPEGSFIQEGENEYTKLEGYSLSEYDHVDQIPINESEYEKQAQRIKDDLDYYESLKAHENMQCYAEAFQDELGIATDTGRV